MKIQFYDYGKILKLIDDNDDDDSSLHLAIPYLSSSELEIPKGVLGGMLDI